MKKILFSKIKQINNVLFPENRWLPFFYSFGLPNHSFHLFFPCFCALHLQHNFLFLFLEKIFYPAFPTISSLNHPSPHLFHSLPRSPLHPSQLLLHPLQDGISPFVVHLYYNFFRTLIRGLCCFCRLFYFTFMLFFGTFFEYER